MKPNFALTLSFEGIRLLHRAFPGWLLVGEVALESDDLTVELQALRDKGTALDASGLRCKLVIPNDQIKYIQFDEATAAADDLADAVLEHLEGATPYAIAELAFDWSVHDGVVSVAAVAKETLVEAEAFAIEHQFNPLSFVAIPEPGDFEGEPFFGQANYAAQLVPDGESIVQDLSPIRIIGAAKLPPGDISARDLSTDGAMPLSSDLPAATPEPATPIPDAPPAAEENTASQSVIPPAPEPQPEAQSGQDALVASILDDTLLGLDDSDPVDRDISAGDAVAVVSRSATDLAAFSSIRARRDDIPSAAPKLDGAERRLTIPAAPFEGADQDIALADEIVREADVATDAQPLEAPQDFLATLQPAPAEPPVEAPRASEPEEAAFSTRRSLHAIAPQPQEIRTQVAAEEERLTVFGTRGADKVPGKPRHLALILTVVLLIFLVGVAAWASLFLDDGLARFITDDDDRQIADVPTDLAQPTAPGGDADIADQSQIDQALREALTQPEAEELTDDVARARYAATGIWQMAPSPSPAPTPGTLDDFYQTSIDPRTQSHDAIALPGQDSAALDTRPETPYSPAQAGTEFALDERGFVIATRDGALTPDGIRVYAGRPAKAPTDFPERAAGTPEVTPSTLQADQRLAALRPRLRPADLSEQNERGTLSGRTRSELAALRPKLRPAAIQGVPDVEEPPQQVAAASNATIPFVDLDAVNQAVTSAQDTDDQFAAATPQAVAASLKPLVRPRNFEKTVKRSAKATEPVVAVSASQRITPRIPTTTSIAKQATERNVLKLRKVNLIGVYGTPSSRRALVRLPNGRYRKVQVGDRLDGGKVSAIGDNELRYKKSGRNLVLRMPKG